MGAVGASHSYGAADINSLCCYAFFFSEEFSLLHFFSFGFSALFTVADFVYLMSVIRM